MKFSLSLDLLVYGVMLLGLSLVGHRLAPEFAGPLLVIGIGGGVLTAGWGVLGLRGICRRVWPIMTLTLIGLLLLVQAVKAWLALKDGAEGLKPVAVIISLLAFLAFGELLNLIQEGRHARATFGGNASDGAQAQLQSPQSPEPLETTKPQS